ncbi:hypothetical protein ZIOFF_032552 [Zingiber officinale]|uniref:Uncharacterized protein n=1 Tax=Zingiber officinale TaxID=94328 RepID=A0A8J5GJ63_ZINOF|nr:hypothetical protein ZIOFF_032552 [Zingiber officinale]
MAAALQTLDAGAVAADPDAARKRRSNHSRAKSSRKRLRQRTTPMGTAKHQKPTEKMKKLFRKRAREYHSDEEEDDVDKEFPEDPSSDEEKDEDLGVGDYGSGGSEGDEEDEEGVKHGITRLLEGCRAFKVAFAKIMKRNLPDDPLGPILSAHKKLVAEKLAEEDSEQKMKGESKKQRHSADEKGHTKPDNFLDAKEKFLISVATKGVVKLFNAVSKAQSSQSGLNPSSSKDAKGQSNKALSLFNLSATCIDLSTCISYEAESPLKHFVECSCRGLLERKWNGQNGNASCSSKVLVNNVTCFETPFYDVITTNEQIRTVRTKRQPLVAFSPTAAHGGRLPAEIFLLLLVMGKNEECHLVKPAVRRKGGKQIKKLFEAAGDASVGYSQAGRSRNRFGRRYGEGKLKTLVLAKRRKQAFFSELQKPTPQISDSNKGNNNEPGWAPLRDSYMLTHSKLKDWDKMAFCSGISPNAYWTSFFCTQEPAAAISGERVLSDSSSDGE